MWPWNDSSDEFLAEMYRKLIDILEDNGGVGFLDLGDEPIGTVADENTEKAEEEK